MLVFVRMNQLQYFEEYWLLSKNCQQRTTYDHGYSKFNRATLTAYKLFYCWVEHYWHYWRDWSGEVQSDIYQLIPHTPLNHPLKHPCISSDWVSLPYLVSIASSSSTLILNIYGDSYIFRLLLFFKDDSWDYADCRIVPLQILFDHPFQLEWMLNIVYIWEWSSF